MHIDRFPTYMGLFSSPNKDCLGRMSTGKMGVKPRENAPRPSQARDGYYLADVSFNLKKTGLMGEIDVPLMGFDLMRRVAGEDEFVTVAKKLYLDKTTDKIPDFHLIYKYGATYEWDIQAVSGNPIHTRDDQVLKLVKEMRFDNGDGSQGRVFCRSFGNTKNSGSNSINGRFVFSITSK